MTSTKDGNRNLKSLVLRGVLIIGILWLVVVFGAPDHDASLDQLNENARESAEARRQMWDEISRNRSVTPARPQVPSSEVETLDRSNEDVGEELCIDAAYEIEANLLVNEYVANEVRADNEYAGKCVEITGVVKDISKDLRGGIFILVNRPIVFSILPRSVQCYFPDSANESIANLDVGQRVTVKGRVSGLLLHVRMTSCTLESTE